MRRVFFLLIILLVCQATYGKDKIYVKGGQKIKGAIIELENNRVVIQRGKELLEFAPEHVELIEFDIQNVKISKILAENAEEYGFSDGQMDAQMYHKRFGGNFALGFFFGVFGFIGVAVGNVKEPPPHIEDWKAKVNDGDYMMGYDKKGKGKNLGAAGVGWAVGFVILLILML